MVSMFGKDTILKFLPTGPIDHRYSFSGEFMPEGRQVVNRPSKCFLLQAVATTSELLVIHIAKRSLLKPGKLGESKCGEAVLRVVSDCWATLRFCLISPVSCGRLVAVPKAALHTQKYKRI